MPLSASEFVPREFYNLLTGAMADQPVTLSNTLSVGGDQREDQPGLRVYGDLEVYGSRADTTPRYSLGPQGLRWSSVALETMDSGALRVGPLVVDGTLIVHDRIVCDAIDYPGVESYVDRYFHELAPGTVAVSNRLVVGNADPWQAGLAYAQAQLVARASDLTQHSPVSSALSLLCWSGNWLQFNVRFWDDDPTQAWPAKRVTLDFDADNLTPGTGGRITLQNGKVGIGRVTDVEGAITALNLRMAALEASSAMYAGQGPPPYDIPGSQPGDLYIDATTGDLWKVT